MTRILLIGPTGRGGPADDACLAAFRRSLPDWDLGLVPDPGTNGVRPVSRSSAVTGAVRAGRRVDAVGVVGPLRAGIQRRLAPLLAMSGAALGSGTRLAAFGVRTIERDGVTEARRLVRTLVRRADLMILRDEGSAAALLGLGIRPPFRVGTHLAWAAVEPRAQRLPATDQALVFVSRRPGTRTGAERAAGLVMEADRLGLEPVLVPWGPGGDVRLVQDLATWLPARVESPAPGLAELVARIGHAAVVASPMPVPIIVAACCGVPSIGLAGDREIREVVERLDQPILPLVADRPEVGDALRAAVDQPVRAAAVRAEVATAAEMFRLFRLLVEDGSFDLNGLSGLRLSPFL